MTAVQDRALLRRAIMAIWNCGALDLADRLFHADYVNHGGVIPDLVRGPEAIKLSVALYRRAFPGLYVAVERLETDEGTVVLGWAASAVPPGAPSAAQGATLRGVTRVRITGGQIAESWTSWDQASVLRQLGLVMPDQAGS